MRQPKKIRELFDAIDAATQKFQEGIPAIEKQMFDEIINLAKELEIKNGRIANTISNFKILGKLKNKLKSVILSKKYIQSIKEFTKTFDVISDIQQAYFAEFASNKKITSYEFLQEVRNQSVESTVNYLTEAGLDANVLGKINDILRQNISTGGKFSDFTDQLRGFLLSKDNNLGALKSYSQQIVTDSLNTYSRTYMETVTNDLGLEWYMYTGSLMTTSRPWCKHMVDKLYVHKSEFAIILKSNIDGVEICSEDIPCNNKTKLPQGMKANTTVENLAYNAGGWQCGHKFIAVSELAVPENIRLKVYASPEYKRWKSAA